MSRDGCSADACVRLCAVCCDALCRVCCRVVRGAFSRGSRVLRRVRLERYVFCARGVC